MVDYRLREARNSSEEAPSQKIAMFHQYRTIAGEGVTGGATYERSALELLQAVSHRIPSELLHLVFETENRESVPSVISDGERVLTFRVSLFERWVSEKPGSIFSPAIRKLGLLRIRRALEKLGTDLAYFSSPSHMALRLGDFPYIFTVWDTGHRDLPEFEEMASPKEYATRENLYQNAIPQAFHVMVDSVATGKKLEKFYGLKPENWSAIGLLPRVDDVPILEATIAEEYIIYPAARWRHKNHATLFAALKKVLVSFPGLKLVLTGADTGYGAELDTIASEMGISEAVVDLGLVQKSELLGLIRGAKALVMPTLLGPTNIPPLEALALGTHAIVSDIHDFGTEVDELLVKVPATDPVAWTEAIISALGKENPEPVNFSLDEAIEAHVAVFRRFQELSN